MLGHIFATFVALLLEDTAQKFILRVFVAVMGFLVAAYTFGPHGLDLMIMLVLVCSEMIY